MPTASSNIASRFAEKPPRMSKRRRPPGSITILTPFSLDLYLPVLPGRRPPLLCGLALLVLGSVGCAWAWAAHAP
jgi:hypothetical protein